MMNARRELSDPSRSIHLVAKKVRNADLAPNLIFPSLRTTDEPSILADESLIAGRVSTPTGGHEPSNSPNPASVLREIVELLEDYSPIWYSEEIHDRAMAALAAPSAERQKPVLSVIASLHKIFHR